MTNNLLTSEQLLESLQENKNKKVFLVTGYVKLKEDESNNKILFSFLNRLPKWEAIPVSLIDSVEILGKAIHDEQIVTIVNLFLIKPTSEESSFLVDIINLLDHEIRTNGVNKLSKGISDGTLPLKGISDGTLPLMGISDGTLPLMGINDGTLPLRLFLKSWQVGNG